MTVQLDRTHASVPDAVTRARSRRQLIWPALAAVGLVGACIALHARDPHNPGSWGICPLYGPTGLYCPACGGLRAVNDLTHGNIGAAASSNLLFVLAIPLMVGWWGAVVADLWRGTRRPLRGLLVSRRWILAACVVTAAFTVLRNTPWGAWLAP